jgi:hypothetical protein
MLFSVKRMIATPCFGHPRSRLFVQMQRIGSLPREDERLQLVLRLAVVVRARAAAVSVFVLTASGASGVLVVVRHRDIASLTASSVRCRST